MNALVVDTNVPVVANGRSQQADPNCVVACVDALLKLRDSGMIVLDELNLILNEYMTNLNMSGQPGAGDLFMKWVWSIQADEEKCEQVRITPKPGSLHDFIEFPEDEDLKGFDLSDRKFVAVAVRSLSTPKLLNAVDSDWAQAHMALKRNGVDVIFLCPQHVRPIQIGRRVAR